ncbi:MAG: alpha/beta hydrolase [Pseudobacteriovorax sp.]|nr:alpha/beta hydrolase [Pseudobacteriovorax sp.]
MIKFSLKVTFVYIFYIVSTVVRGNEFFVEGQRAWFHDPGFSSGYFHSYDALSLDGVPPFKMHVFLPRDYETSQDNVYPLLIALDGNTAFFRSGLSGSSLNLQDALARYDEAYPQSKLPIVAALVPNNRAKEYTHDTVLGQDCCELDRFLSDLTHGIIPWLKRHYRIDRRASTLGITGSSHGGLAAFAAAMYFPEVFGYAIVQSPSFWVGFESQGRFFDRWGSGKMAKTILKRWSDLNIKGDRKPRLWIDWGLIHQGGFHNEFIERYVAKRSPEVLNWLRTELSYQDQMDLYFMIDEQGEHSEASWSRRLWPAIEAVGPHNSTN